MGRCPRGEHTAPCLLRHRSPCRWGIFPEWNNNNSQNLNIWTPRRQRRKKRPVMVWLHGGGFSTGSANEEDMTVGPPAAAEMWSLFQSITD
ncbi:MAG: carboxylesterase family protein [Clostridiaceae bacterium]